MKKLVLFIFFMALLLMFMLGCSPKPRSAMFTAPIEEPQDTTAYKPTVVEKTGFVLLAIFAFHQITKGE